jgi:LPS sulfotransferase NodH
LRWERQFLSEELSAYYAYYTRKSRPEQRHLLIFAQGRTGSSLLEALLESTGNLKAHGEILSPLDTHTKRPALSPAKYAIGMAKQDTMNFACHVKIYQLTMYHNADPASFLKLIRGAGWKIIFLHRRNKVRHVLSGVIAEHRGDYHKRNDQAESLSITVDISLFEQRMLERLYYDAWEQHLMHGIEHLSLVYEEDLMHQERHQATVDRIMTSVGLETGPVNCGFRRINTQPVEETVINFQEFAACLKRNGWEHYLREKK